VFQYTFDWVWTVTQQGTVDGLTSGMAIGEFPALEYIAPPQEILEYSVCLFLSF
jgi:hypothetical protein